MRKSISVSFFSNAALLLLLGIFVMGLSQMCLFAKYFAVEKYNAEDKVAAVAVQAADAFAAKGPDAEATQQAGEKLRLIGKTADALLILTDADGNVLMSMDDAIAQNTALAPEILTAVAGADETGENYHALTDLNGALSGRCYVTACRIAAPAGEALWLFIYTPVNSFTGFAKEMFSNFLLSASLMLLCASFLSMLLTQKMTSPLHKISEAAKKFGGGDFSTRVEDVTGDDEVAQLAANFNTMAANLEAIDHSRAEFTGNIAHELRTPMTTIKGFVDGILDGTIPPELEHHYLAIVSQEVGRLARLVQNMLDITKLEAGEYQVHARLYNVWETLSGAAISAEQRITAGKIRIEGLEPDAKELVYADADLVHQVVYNLLDNAIKFTPEDGVIRLSAQRLGPEVEIAIWNSGVGIGEDALPFVFERFYKEDKSRGLNAKGSGLGLHICKVLVNLSGGQIRVESKQGEWCRFVFTLPAELPNKRDLLKLSDQTDDPSNDKQRKKV
ncbi:MAG: HAMP domain-containing histidine kinase [Faecalibacterium sp.]|jgi:signal transduction histidine kinase|nr:HAMP domain-containing histidine kinase [Faecalibacterium sp.]